MFVKAIETLPALAVSEVVSNLSWPSGSAARLSVCPALAPLAGAGVEDAAELDVVGVAAGLAGGVLADELLDELPLDELPQPAASNAASATLSAIARRIVRWTGLQVVVAFVIACPPCRCCLGGSLSGSCHAHDLSSLTPLGFNTYQSEPKLLMPWP
jgi:hypothetical protein